MNGPSGIYIPLITPYRNGEIDYEGMIKLARYYVNQGVDGLMPMATTGEAPVLSESEEHKILSLFTDELSHVTNLYFGLCGNNTAKMISKINKMNEYKFRGYLISTPYYNLPSQKGLLSHFRQLSAATDKEILIYNIPYRTGRNMENETILELAGEMNITGIKDSCGKLEQSLELIRDKPDGFTVLTGEDLFFMSNVCNGGDGGIMASAHINCRKYIELYRCLQQNKLEEAIVIWKEISMLIPLLFREPNPGPLKYLLCSKGCISSAEVRSPLEGISEPLKQQLEGMKVDDFC